MTHFVDTDKHPVDQSDSHHPLQVLHGRVPVHLLHNEMGKKFGNVPSQRRDIVSV